MKFTDKQEFEKANKFGTGAPNTAYAKFFIGDSFLNPLTDPKTGLFAANVTFEPGCRNNWHIHHATSGGGQPARGQRHHDSGERQALARRQGGQLVLAHRSRGPGHGLLERVVRAGQR